MDEDLAAKYFQLVVDTMESKMLQQLRRQLSDLFGRDFAVEVGLGQPRKGLDHLQRLCSEVVGSVTGALMTLAHDKALKGRLIAAVGAVRFRYDNGVKGETLELADGVLTVACGGLGERIPGGLRSHDREGQGSSEMTEPTSKGSESHTEGGVNMSDPKQDALEAIDPPGKGDETDSSTPNSSTPVERATSSDRNWK